MTKIEKKKVTLSLPCETNEKLEKLAQNLGMTKSGFVNYLVRKAEVESVK